jgi:hypothetical protein
MRSFWNGRPAGSGEVEGGVAKARCCAVRKLGQSFPCGLNVVSAFSVSAVVGFILEIALDDGFRVIVGAGCKRDKEAW